VNIEGVLVVQRKRIENNMTWFCRLLRVRKALLDWVAYRQGKTFTGGEMVLSVTLVSCRRCKIQAMLAEFGCGQVVIQGMTTKEIHLGIGSFSVFHRLDA